MTVRYDVPNLAARAGSELIRWLAEAGISIAGTQACGSAAARPASAAGVVINLLTVDGRDFVVSPRGNTSGRATRGRPASSSGAALAQPGDPHRGGPTRPSPDLLKRYLDRWYWEVKGHVGGLTPRSDRRRTADAARPSRCSSCSGRASWAGGGDVARRRLNDVLAACWLAVCQDTAAGSCPRCC